MKTLRNYISEVRDFEVKEFNEEIFEYIEENCLEAWGYGQESHSTAGTPEYVIYKLDQKDFIEVDGFVCKAITNDNGILYLQEDYNSAKEAAEDDGRGEGFEVK